MVEDMETLGTLKARIDGYAATDDANAPVCSDYIYWDDDVYQAVAAFGYGESWTREDSAQALAALADRDSIRDAIWEVLDAAIADILNARQYPLDGNADDA